MMNSSCIDFVMFSRGQHDEDNMSRRQWKRERSAISTHHHHHLNFPAPNEDEELANCLVLLSNSGDAYNKGKGKTVKKQKTAQVFQCKACKKVFASHQALGGHRASHKKVKGCFASQDKEEEEEEEEEEYKEDDDEDEADDDEDEEETEDNRSTAHVARKRSNAHECTICHRVFSSGQALGGHKRCHWLTPSSNYLRMTPIHDSAGRSQPSLDLNLACQEYSVDPTAMSVGMTTARDGGGSNHNATPSNSWLKLASGDWS
ncbi:unnamed protein product [Microthlaspi erraticum]|uniref:C2H2-type domain-containing protein n=1 Tax=Microthlaspi erraticum TaxID=1685480 RepID=A0A6D2IEW1_9BRAS|nr:unnamed protein product [Microthlaspi erraticum]